MWSGTSRIGLIVPGSTRPSVRLWHRLYFRPLPHQHGSLAWGSTAGALGRELVTTDIGPRIRSAAAPDAAAARGGGDR